LSASLWIQDDKTRQRFRITLLIIYGIRVQRTLHEFRSSDERDVFVFFYPLPSHRHTTLSSRHVSPLMKFNATSTGRERNRIRLRPSKREQSVMLILDKCFSREVVRPVSVVQISGWTRSYTTKRRRSVFYHYSTRIYPTRLSEYVFYSDVITVVSQRLLV